MLIRHPRTWGRLGALRSALFMRWQLRDGRIVANWPYYMRDYFQRTRTFEPAEFEFLEPAA
jgi:hypothetical protein